MPDASMVGLDILIPARFTLREVILPADALSSLNATEPIAISAHSIHGAFDPVKDPGQDAEESFDLVMAVELAQSDPDGTSGLFGAETDGAKRTG
jgi:hypothetical protein